VEERVKLTVLRYSTFLGYGGSTFGLLFINGSFFCYTLEDEERAEKVYSETCVNEGIYGIKLKASGEFHEKYLKRFPAFHKGMLEIMDVPFFENVLIHCGNTDDDTAGCLLVGDKVNNNTVTSAFLEGSAVAYERLYKLVMNDMDLGRPVTIEYRKFRI